MSAGEPASGGTRAGDGLRARLRLVAQHQVARFASVGVANTLVDLGLFVLLTLLGMAVVPANFLSTSAGMAVSFLGNRRFVFGATGHVVREVTLFTVVCAIGIWVIQPLLILGVSDLLERLGIDLGDLGLWFAKCVAILVAAVWNFFLYKHLVFRGSRSTAKA